MSDLATALDPAGMPGPNPYEAQRAAHEALEGALRATNRTALFAVLAAAGISHVVVSYDGYSDSGQIESVEARAGDTVVALPAGTVVCAVAKWGNAEPSSHAVPITEMVERIVYDLLETTHAGWENGEGAYGEFVFDVAANSVTLDHAERYTATESYSYRF